MMPLKSGYKSITFSVCKGKKKELTRLIDHGMSHDDIDCKQGKPS